MDHLVRHVGKKEFGPDRRAVSRDEPFRFLATKDRAAQRINSDHFGLQFVFADLFATTSQRAAGAGRNKEVINIAVQLSDNLFHRLMMRLSIVLIGVLIRPKRIWVLVPQRPNPIDTSL